MSLICPPKTDPFTMLGFGGQIRIELETVLALLGHSSIKVTLEFYARVRPEALRKAVGVFDV